MRETRLVRFTVALIREIGEDDIAGMSAEMAYRFLFALVPLLLLLVTTLGFIGDAVGLPGLVARLIESARPLLPPSVIEIVEGVAARMLSERSASFLTLGLIGTLWGAATGVGSLLKGLNRAYDVERPRSLWRRQALGLGVALSLPLIALASIVFVTAGRSLARILAARLGFGDSVASVIDAAQLLLVGVAFFVSMSIVYQRLPNVRIRYRDAIPGTIVALLGLAFLSIGFGLYLDNAAGSVVAYTTFGTAFVFLLWLYLVSLIVLIGAEVNALLGPTGRARWRAGGDRG